MPAARPDRGRRAGQAGKAASAPSSPTRVRPGQPRVLTSSPSRPVLACSTRSTPRRSGPGAGRSAVLSARQQDAAPADPHHAGPAGRGEVLYPRGHSISCGPPPEDRRVARRRTRSAPHEGSSTPMSRERFSAYRDGAPECLPLRTTACNLRIQRGVGLGGSTATTRSPSPPRWARCSTPTSSYLIHRQYSCPLLGARVFDTGQGRAVTADRSWGRHSGPVGGDLALVRFGGWNLPATGSTEPCKRRGFESVNPVNVALKRLASAFAAASLILGIVTASPCDAA